MLQSTCAYTLVGVQEKLKNDSRNEGGAMYDIRRITLSGTREAGGY